MNMKNMCVLVMCLALSATVFAAGALTITDRTTSVSGDAGSTATGTFNVSATGALSSVALTSSDFGGIDSNKISFSTNNFNVNTGASQQVTFTVNIPVTTQTGQYVGTLTATGSNSSNTDNYQVTVVVNNSMKLAITDLDVDVGDEEDSNLEDGDKVNDDAKPKDTVIFSIKVENMYSDAEDITIEDIEITIENDDDLDWDDTEDVDDLDAGDDDRIEMEFTVPSDADKDTYDIEITVEGEDENNKKHKIVWTIQLDVDRERNEVTIKTAYLTNSKVECAPRQTTLMIEVDNTGQRKQDDAKVTVFSADLGIDQLFHGIVIASGDEELKNLPILVSEDLAAGTYPISVKSFYDSDRTSFDAVRSIDLTVADCTTASTGDTAEDAVEDSATTTDSTATAGDTAASDTSPAIAKPVTSSGKTDLGDVRGSSGYMIVLVALVVVFGVIAIAILVKVMTKR